MYRTIDTCFVLFQCYCTSDKDGVYKQLNLQVNKVSRMTVISYHYYFLNHD